MVGMGQKDSYVGYVAELYHISVYFNLTDIIYVEMKLNQSVVS